MFEAVFTIQSGVSYEEATDRTDTTIELWCNDHCDLLYVRGEEADRVLNQVENAVGIRDRLSDGDDQVVVTEECLQSMTEDFVENYLSKHNTLLVPPIRYANGAKRCRMLAIDSKTLSDCFVDLTDSYDVHVDTKREIGSVIPDAPPLTTNALLTSLSPRQREVFEVAHAEGYYELPRQSTTEEIAKEIGIQRRTAEDHLRRAEKKLADTVMTYLGPV